MILNCPDGESYSPSRATRQHSQHAGRRQSRLCRSQLEAGRQSQFPRPQGCRRNHHPVYPRGLVLGLLVLAVVTRAGGFKCGEKEFRETRNNYERCATNKISEITSWLTGPGAGLQVSTLCTAVQDLLNSCGDELGWCFTETQVTETKSKQHAGIRDILARYLPPEDIQACSGLAPASGTHTAEPDTTLTNSSQFKEESLLATGENEDEGRKSETNSRPHNEEEEVAPVEVPRGGGREGGRRLQLSIDLQDYSLSLNPSNDSASNTSNPSSKPNPALASSSLSSHSDTLRPEPVTASSHAPFPTSSSASSTAFPRSVSYLVSLCLATSVLRCCFENFRINISIGLLHRV